MYLGRVHPYIPDPWANTSSIRSTQSVANRARVHQGRCAPLLDSADGGAADAGAAEVAGSAAASLLAAEEGGGKATCSSIGGSTAEFSQPEHTFGM